eukprot:TRINITY_DN3555_c0_g1_i1.p1 TRINITY_DN3555_c0_g1~~TRINITY_DN3555_c0_g1_i1.p1  ORF type:complete len:186 (-),score=54.83 TRINITY_DN3555_c0_g1_i1:613-1170(-)
MEHLQRLGIVHGSLSCATVLCCNDEDVGPACWDGEFKRTLVCKVDVQSEASPLASARYSALETLGRPGRFTSKSDVYSWAVCAWQVYADGAEPFGGVDEAGVLKAVVLGTPLPCLPSMPPAAYRLMSLCWSTRPEDRPSFSEVVSVLTAVRDCDNALLASWPGFAQCRDVVLSEQGSGDRFLNTL